MCQTHSSGISFQRYDRMRSILRYKRMCPAQRYKRMHPSSKVWENASQLKRMRGCVPSYDWISFQKGRSSLKTYERSLTFEESLFSAQQYQSGGGNLQSSPPRWVMSWVISCPHCITLLLASSRTTVLVIRVNDKLRAFMRGCPLDSAVTRGNSTPKKWQSLSLLQMTESEAAHFSTVRLMQEHPLQSQHAMPRSNYMVTQCEPGWVV